MTVQMQIFSGVEEVLTQQPVVGMHVFHNAQLCTVLQWQCLLA